MALGDQVFDTLRGLLRNGRFGAGERLTEVMLADRLGVSRTPIREALGRLAAEGLIVARGRSYVVPTMTDADVDDIYELRCLLEPEAIGLVAGRAPSARMLAPIRQALEASAVAHRAGDTEAFIAANARFRAAWLALVPNRRLVHAVEMYAGHVRYLRMLTLDNPQMRNLVLRGLREIVAALAASDREAATRAMRRHLDAAKHCFRAAAGLVEREEDKESVS